MRPGDNPKAIHPVVFASMPTFARPLRVIDCPVKPICVVVVRADAVLVFTTQEGRSACRKHESEEQDDSKYCRKNIRDCSS